MEFRTLRADEIECRIGQIAKDGSGLSLLLYKDARCDMDLLDEIVGPMNWKREHHVIDGKLCCTVSIWDAEKGQWISKQDVGTESNTEAVKGMFSDSFKRACVNIGLGRELYTAPFIWVKEKDCKIENRRCKDHFSVKEIGYDEHRNIDRLVIVNDKTEKVVYTKGKNNSYKDYAESNSETQTYVTDLDSAKKEYQYRCKRANLGAQDILEKAGWSVDKGKASLEDFEKANIILDEMGVPA